MSDFSVSASRLRTDVKPNKKARNAGSASPASAPRAPRLPHASRQHVPFPAEPNVLHGVSPVEAGRIAQERALQARSRERQAPAV